MGERRNWRNVVKRYKVLAIRHVSTGDVMYNMMTIANTIVRYTGKLLGEVSSQG